MLPWMAGLTNFIVTMIYLLCAEFLWGSMEIPAYWALTIGAIINYFIILGAFKVVLEDQKLEDQERELELRIDKLAERLEEVK